MKNGPVDFVNSRKTEELFEGAPAFFTAGTLI
jgi:hypothetical protein